MGVNPGTVIAVVIVVAAFILGPLYLVAQQRDKLKVAWKYRQVCVEYQIDKPADCVKLGPGLVMKKVK